MESIKQISERLFAGCYVKLADLTAEQRKAVIEEIRLQQTLDELERKRKKSVSRHRLWQQEEIDAAKANGRKLHQLLSANFT